MHIHFDQSKRRFVFLFVVAAVYFSLVFGLDGLTGPAIWDEPEHWQASLFFRDRPLPTLQDLNNYGGLNTPLPFILFGTIERWFGLGISGGRWLNLLLSLGVVFAIGWPRKPEAVGHSGKTATPKLLCLMGLLACPYFLFASGRLYTDMVACFWVLAGYMGYVHKRHTLSSVAFVLAIASRQYMLAFPLAIATYELVIWLLRLKADNAENAQVTLSTQSSKLAALRPFVSALVAVLSMAGWFYVFGGLTPKTAIVHSIQTSNSAGWAATQQTFWAIRPGVALNYLAYVGLYLVIPEWLLFRTTHWGQALKQHWRSAVLISGVLLLLFLLCPPLVKSQGLLAKLVYRLPADIAQMAVLYGLVLLACLRFSQFEPLTLMVFFNSLIMMKAHPWDRYVLPMAVVFWYAKSEGLAEASSRVFPVGLVGRLSVWQHDGKRGSHPML